MRQRYSPPEYHRCIERPKAGDWACPMLWNWEIQGVQHIISMQKLRFPSHPRTKVRRQVPPDQVLLEHSHYFGNIAVHCEYYYVKTTHKYDSRFACVQWYYFCLRTRKGWHKSFMALTLEFSFVPLFISYRGSGEKLIKFQANSSCVIISVILMTTLFYKALILQGEIWFWSLSGLKGLSIGKRL